MNNRKLTVFHYEIMYRSNVVYLNVFLQTYSKDYAYFVTKIMLIVLFQRNTVRLWLRRFEETGNIQKNRPGPKPVMYTRTKENLAQLVTSTWEFMRGSDCCWNMVRGMRNRLKQVIEKMVLHFAIKSTTE